MRSTRKVLWAFFFAMPFLILNAGNALAISDDYTPEVTARVARISHISGDVQIKRADQSDWERAAQNLPIVEGDEIATDKGARLEIQFSSESYLRLSENAYLKITTLRDEGVAVSLPNGSLSVRILTFDKTRSYFEIDAPQTTVSVEKSGMYRVDAGGKNDSEVRVSVTDSGQARVYSENSGFTLKNGRSATVQIGGNYAGEWETSDAAKYADDFDSWALQRDAIIAKRLENAHYDKYYDRDFYGAEDLNEYGEWIYTRKHGYVWRPYRDSVARYADWSPYRYGQWRWIPPYGWTWVNDEPWGWATYHHGRWVWDDGGWYWAPYSQYRGRRSWWRPALVFISYIGSSICWYPLPYGYDYYNYNSYYYNDRRRYNTTIVNNTTVIVNPTPAPTPAVAAGTILSPGKINPRLLAPPSTLIPAAGVVTVDASAFGTGKSNFRIAPVNLAKKVLAETPSEIVKPPMLPTFKDLNGNVSKEILAANPRNTRAATQIKTGAIERTSGVSMGENLRRERILGNRPPIEKTAPRTETNGGLESAPPIRNTGAVKRQPRVESSPSSGETPIRQSPENIDLRNTNRIRPSGGNNNNNENESQPVRKPRIRSDEQGIAPPVYNPPPQPEGRIERQQPQPPRRERQEEPVRQEPPRQEPRVEAPTRIEPPRQEPVRQEPPPRQDSPAEKPAAPTNEIKGKPEKDG
ncbi:MAG: hypothetical protein AVDCRST_MAG74-1007 [uncultured Pyrinomonadaceae bacterium]|uniref:FecR protein domain-containing protein n=1 Tax=uncultured Pyrinomonadaceae bacterium TaxID=2283094 RepID=A0A6J4NPN7_9BACT|nr:MAG: hypothetical protein AVDCRST_MAG74-1007 [uncultured Pyrinomonadaceae bacterium]